MILILRFVVCIILILNSILIIISSEIDDCNLIMHNINGFGVGIYAGKTFKPTDVVEEAIAISVPKYVIDYNILEQYVEGFNETHDLVCLGYGMLYNHAPAVDGRMLVKNITNYMDESLLNGDIGQRRSIKYVSNWAIFPGDQIWSYYGEEWFTQRNIHEVSSRQQINRNVIHIDNIYNSSTRIPGCATELTYIDPITNQIKAKRKITKDDIIEISRGLLIPERIQLVSNYLSKFLWYNYIDEETLTKYENMKKFISETPSLKPETITLQEKNDGQNYNEESRYSLLLLGYGALYSSSSINIDQSNANVDYDWYFINDNEDGKINYVDLEGNFVNKINMKQPKKLKKKRSNCLLSMFVQFKANRDINIGEVLSIDLYIDKITNKRYPAKKFSNLCL